MSRKKRKRLEPRVVTIVRIEGGNAQFRYLEALPGAAAANGGRPVVLLVGSRLGPAAECFLRKFKPEKIRIHGAPLNNLPGTKSAVDAWRPGGVVIVAEKNIQHAVPAAALAARLRAPLLVTRPGWESRLLRLKPARVLTVGSVEFVRWRGPTERLKDSIAVAKRAKGADYVALFNSAPGKGSETGIFAAALAATHLGTVLPVRKIVRWHIGRLRITSKPPPGMPTSPTGKYGAGTIRLGSESILVGAPQIGTIKLPGHPDAPRFGRPRIDLNRDGRLSSGVGEPEVGSTVYIGRRRFAFTARFTSPHGNSAYLRSSENQVLLLEPDPDEIRAELRSFISAIGGIRFLAIVGKPDRIPFCRRECRSYFDGYSFQQEIATDGPYGTIDDGSLSGLAVGRLLPEGLEDGSAMIATSIAYPQMKGAWRRRACIIQPGDLKREKATGYPWVLPEGEALLKAIGRDLAEVGMACDDYFRDDVIAKPLIRSLSDAGWILFHNHSDQQSWRLSDRSKIVPTVDRRDGADAPQGVFPVPELEGAPIVYCGGCLSAGIDLGFPREKSFPERFFQLGAVAYIGNTRDMTAGSEFAVKVFFDRMLFDGAALGEAFRDGRNHLAHLLKMRHLDPGFRSWPMDPWIYEKYREQYYNMNLFGDPALRLEIPSPRVSPPISVGFGQSGSKRGRARLVVRRLASERLDAVRMLPAVGEGDPRDVVVRTGPGMTFTELPSAGYMSVEQGLAPIRGFPSVPAGCWVDVALPSGAHGVKVRLARGPVWADRGFATERGLDGRQRLQMFVPLTLASLEAGKGHAAKSVSFDVTFKLGAASRVRRMARESRVWQGIRWSEKPCGGRGLLDRSTRELLERIENRIYSPIREGLRAAELTVRFPDSRVFGKSWFRAEWRLGRPVTVKGFNLPRSWEPRRSDIERGMASLVLSAIGCGYDWAVPSPGYHAVRKRDGHGLTVLEFSPATPREGDELTLLRLSADEGISGTRVRRFGMEQVRRFEWGRLKQGLVLRRMVVEYGAWGESVVQMSYKDLEGFQLPVRIVCGLPGYVAGADRFELTYHRLSRS